jgi:hypothetical protein
LFHLKEPSLSSQGSGVAGAACEADQSEFGPALLEMGAQFLGTCERMSLRAEENAAAGIRRA